MSIRPLTNTWPPHVLQSSDPALMAFADAQMRTNTWPPLSVSRRRLEGLTSKAAHAQLLRGSIEHSAGPPVAGGGKPPPTDPAHDAEREALRTRSTAVIGHLLACEFSSRLRLSIDPPAPWSLNADVPGFRLKLTDTAGTLLNHKQAAIAAADLKAAVQAVRVDGKRLSDILVQAPNPELILLYRFKTVRDADFSGEDAALWWTAWIVDALIETTSSVLHRLKHAIRLARPADPCFQPWLPSPLQPLLPEPAYTAYPGGHSCQMAALSVVLCRLSRCDAAERLRVEALAEDIGRNRERAGLHSAVDTDAGWVLGQALGHAFLDAVGRVDRAGQLLYPSWTACFDAAGAEW